MLINRSEVKKYVLYIAKTRRPEAGFTRVSDKFYQRIDACLRAKITSEIHAHPSKGVTIK